MSTVQDLSDMAPHALSSLPLLVLLFLSFQSSVSRSVSPSERLVLSLLEQKKKAKEMEVIKQAAREKVVATRECEKRVYSRISRGTQGGRSADRPEMDPEDLRNIDNLRNHMRSIKDAEDQKLNEVEEWADEERKEILTVSSRVRAVDCLFTGLFFVPLTLLGTLVFFIIIESFIFG